MSARHLLPHGKVSGCISNDESTIQAPNQAVPWELLQKELTDSIPRQQLRQTEVGVVDMTFVKAS